MRKRRTRLAAVIPLLVAAYVAAWNAQDAQAARKPDVRFGLGATMGDPLGGSMKLFLHAQHALQLDVGWAPMHHGNGISHITYLFHIKPFVEHRVFDFGMYLGGGVGVAFWAAGIGGRRCYDPPGPDDFRCDGYYYRRHWRYRRAGAAMVARSPVGVFMHFKDVPIDVVMEGGWSPYIVVPWSGWDPFHGDVAVKCRYYF